MSKPIKRFVLVPADVYFAQEEDHKTSTLPPQPKKPKSTTEQELKLEIIKEEADQSPLNVTEKTTQLNVLDRLKQTRKEANDVTTNIHTKIQTVISKLIEQGFSSSKLERSRVILQAFFKESRLSLNEEWEIQLDGSGTQLNLLTFLNDLQVPNKKLNEAALNILRQLQVSKHIISNVRARDVAQQYSSPSPMSWIERF